MSLNDELKLVGQNDAIQVALSELKKNANPKCKKCWGRGHIGRDTITGNYHACSKCLRRRREAE